MADTAARLAALLADAVTLDDARAMGADYVRNGANTTNCHFTLFASRELTQAWEQGRDAALAGEGKR